MRNSHRTALIVPLGLAAALLLAACGGDSSPGSARILVTYVDENGEEQKVSVHSDETACSEYVVPKRRIATADGAVSALVDSSGRAQIQVQIDRTTSFQSTATSPADETGFQVEGVEGVVLRLSSGIQKKISEKASVTGTFTCPD